MSAETDGLVLDLLEWLAPRPDAHDEVMEARLERAGRPVPNLAAVF